MYKEFNYTLEDYANLKIAYENSNFICFKRPDQFQFYQNELSKEIAKFLLKPYMKELEEKSLENSEEIKKYNNEK